VDDEPQKEMTNEIALIQKLEKEARMVLTESQEMLRLLRKCNYELDHELKAKEMALSVDTKALNLNEHHFQLHRETVGKGLNDYIW